VKILTTPVTAGTHGTCEFCPAPAVWRSQQVDASSTPLRVPVLACRRHKTHGRLLAEVTPAVEVEEEEAG